MKLRKICALVLALVFSVALIGCGDKKPSVKPEVKEPFALFFDHGFNKQVQTDTTSTKKTSYTMYAGKNEIENCQFILAATDKDYENLTAEVTDFVNGDSVIPATMYMAMYFTADHKMIPDAMLPYGGEAFTVKKDNSQIFFAEAEIPSDAAAGDYTATVTVKDESGAELKSGTVTLHVWDFVLSEETSNTVVMDLENGRITAACGQSDLYGKYYDYMLKNRISLYDLPVDYTSAAAEKYLDNPRVRGFRVRSASDAPKIKTMQQTHPEWAEKAFFYIVDEPAGKEDWDRIRSAGNSIKSVLGDNYRHVSPFFKGDFVSGEDCLEYMRDSINVWCPKTVLYASAEEWENSSDWNKPGYELLEFIMLTDKSGAVQSFEQRMQEYRNEGDELWWYTCWDPVSPFISLNIEEKGVNPRIMFWQQKYFGITGYLYFLVNEWGASTEGSWEWAADSWDSHYKVNSLGEDTWGDGQLIYCGETRGYDGPVGSFRLNAVRDGIEDYEYLTMLEKIVGKTEVNKIISAITTSVTVYTSDAELFASQRILLGNTLEAKLKSAN